MVRIRLRVVVRVKGLTHLTAVEGQFHLRNIPVRKVRNIPVKKKGSFTV